MYSREDVTARSLANGYSQSLGTIFSQELKPLEVEILVVQVGHNGQANEMYRISFDGSIIDERTFAVIGGKSEAVQALLKEKGLTQPPELQAALTLCITALEHIGNQKLSLESLEVAVLDRTRDGRKFRRLSPADTKQLPPPKCLSSPIRSIQSILSDRSISLIWLFAFSDQTTRPDQIDQTNQIDRGCGSCPSVEEGGAGCYSVCTRMLQPSPLRRRIFGFGE